MSRLSTVSALALSTLLSACSILPEPEQLHVYRLPAAAPSTTATAPRSALTLQVNRPDSAQMLDSTRIVVLPDGDQISTYQGVRWSDRAPVLLRDRLVDGFISANRFAAVSRDENLLQTDLKLVSSLSAFQSEYRNGAPVVRIQLDAQLVDSHQQILASQRFTTSQGAADDSVATVVKAFGQASDQLASQVISWATSQSSQHKQP